MFKQLKLENFTAFKCAQFDWVPGVNVLIGANGTGKTHIMKLIYALQMEGHDKQALKKKLATVFRPSGGRVSRLVNRKRGSSAALKNITRARGYGRACDLFRGTAAHEQRYR